MSEAGSWTPWPRPAACIRPGQGPKRPARPAAQGGNTRIDHIFKRFFKRRPASLADCTACGADFVHPVEWSPNDGGTWWMLLRCGACGVSREETVPDAEADRYDRELDLAEDRMLRVAERLSRERLAAEADSFATALELDLIGVEDFARPPGGA
jgi:hypothetical protein